MPLEIPQLLQPIGDAAPGGVSLRYEPVYEQIRQARIEEEELPSGEWQTERRTADYGLVVRLATDALARRTKDLQLAAWLTEALLKREGFAGLASGLRLTASLLQDFWDHLYPELDDDGDAEFRAAPLEWVGGYLDRAVRLVPIDAAGHTIAQQRDAREVGYEADAKTYEAKDARKAALAAGRLTAEEFDTGFNATPKAWYKQLISEMDAALEALDALDLVCQERFGSVAPRFSPLRGAIAEVRQEVSPLLARKLAVEPDPVVEEPLPELAIEAPSHNGDHPAGDASGAAPAAAAPAAAAPSSPAPGTRADAEMRLAAIARFLRAEKPADPAPYLLLRGFRWGELRGGDGRIEPALLVAPTTEVRTRLKTLLLAERWRELLEVGEEAMAAPSGRGWLDLQRYTVSACDALAGEYARVATAIRTELRALLHDLPFLATTTLTDDTPAANGDTLAWLRAEGLLANGAGADAPLSPPQLRGDPLLQAQQLVRAGQPQKALELLTREAQQSRSARGRFLRRSQAAGIMVEGGMEPVALPILQQLVEQVQKYSLEEWEEPETVASTLSLLYRCLLKVGANAAATQDLYLRVCRLDPMQALQLPTAK